MGDRDWTEYLGFRPDGHEGVVLDHLALGKPADVGAELAEVNGELAAEVVRVACWDPGNRLPDRVVLKNARIRDRLDLSGLHLRHGLSFRHCTFAAGVDLTGAVCDEPVEFVDCEIRGLAADHLTSCKDVSAVECRIDGASFAGARLEHDLRLSHSRLTGQPGCAAFHGPDMAVEGGLFLDHATVIGGVTLDSSHIGHDLDCRGSDFQNGGALALNATWVTVGRELRCDEGFHADGEVRLCWAEAELVSFRNANLHNPAGPALRADSLRTTVGCYLDQNLHAAGTVRLVGAQIAGELSCSGGRFDGRAGVAIEADRLTARDVYLDRGFQAHGAVRLVGVILERQLTCTGGHFDNPSGRALDATGMICRGSVYLDKAPDLEQGFTANGQVRLTGASVAEAVVCTAGLFAYAGDAALHADGLTTDGNIMLDDGFRAAGGVRLARATVGRQLDCTGGSFHPTGGGVALDLTGLVGRGDVLLSDGFRATGEVLLRDAEVARDVNLTEGHLADSGKKSLDAYGLRVGGSLILLPAEQPAQLVDLRYARAERLHDSAVSYPENGVELEGFTYRSIEDGLTHEQRIDILGRMRHFSRQPYQQLSRVYREASKDIAEREVAVAGLRQLRDRDQLKFHSKAWNVFMWLTVRYGYRIYQPFLIALPFVLLNIIFYHTAEHHGLMEPVGANTGDKTPAGTTVHCPKNYPCFNPAAYSVQLLIPAINLYQIDKWVPDGTRPWGSALFIWTWVMIILGWVLGFALVATINQSLRRE